MDKVMQAEQKFPGVDLLLFFSDANLKFTLRPSNNLVDDSFAFIMRNGEEAPKIYENSLKLAEKYANCFYQGDNSAFDLCDGNIVSNFNPIQWQ